MTLICKPRGVKHSTDTRASAQRGMVTVCHLTVILTGTAAVLLTVVDSRRTVNRHSDTSSSSSSATVTSRDFAFSQKLNSTCRPSGSVSRREQFRDIVEIVRSKLSQLTTEMVFSDCYGMALTSLSCHSDPGLTQSSIHLSFTNLLAHFFIMKMDWTTSTGLPCLDTNKEIRVRRLHTRLIESWQNLNCVFLKSITAEEYEGAGLVGNVNTVLDTPIMRYSACRERTVRDCVLMQQAANTLRLSESFLTSRGSNLVLL